MITLEQAKKMILSQFKTKNPKVKILNFTISKSENFKHEFHFAIDTYRKDLNLTDLGIHSIQVNDFESEMTILGHKDFTKEGAE